MGDYLYSEDLQQVILGFPAGLQARYVHLTERMLAFGPNLGMPHTRALGSGLFELRMKSKEAIGRVFFLHAGGAKNHDAPCFHQEVFEDAGQGAENCPVAASGGEGKC